MRIAVLGDVHGRFQAAAQLVQSYQEHTKLKVETVLQVGDLMPNRDAQDMEFSCAGEAKYRYPGDFHLYHEGGLKFPGGPMLFIGGNHDPYNWLDHFPAGGWLNNWLYYLGRSVDTEHEGLHICGISGIYHPKKSPVDSRSAMPVVRTAADRKAYTYMVQGEVEAMLEVEKKMPCDILLLHDWPQGIDRRP
ncbi:MAG TPA: metallophosphoesterase, partial [bacterium]|nr:metallophosphoesterase [bacterium]